MQGRDTDVAFNASLLPPPSRTRDLGTRRELVNSAQASHATRFITPLLIRLTWRAAARNASGASSQTAAAARGYGYPITPDS